MRAVGTHSCSECEKIVQIAEDYNSYSSLIGQDFFGILCSYRAYIMVPFYPLKITFNILTHMRLIIHR